MILEICHRYTKYAIYLILIVLNDEPLDCISTSEICAVRYFGHFGARASDSVKRRTCVTCAQSYLRHSSVITLGDLNLSMFLNPLPFLSQTGQNRPLCYFNNRRFSSSMESLYVGNGQNRALCYFNNRRFYSSMESHWVGKG